MKRFLLVDDDKEDGELFKDALEEIGANFLFDYFDDGKVALDKLTNNLIAIPDYVFLDINMPTMSGWEFLTILKKNHLLFQVPVIMYSTSSQKREKELALELGASAFVTKPTDFRSLKYILSIIIETPLPNVQEKLKSLTN